MNCQNFHTMSPMKQTLCRRLKYQFARALAWLTWLLVLAGLPAWVGPSWAANPKAAVGAVAPGKASEPLAPEQVLMQSVRQWVAKQQGGQPEQVQLVPLDNRVRVQACAQALTMDHPFASTETIRVRCAEPVWQLYMRLQPAARAASLASAAGASESRRAVVVASLPLVRGMTVQASDVRVQNTVLPPGGGNFLEDVGDALYAELLRDIPAGTPLRKTDLRPLVLVKRGQLVQLTVGKSTGFVVTAHVEALQDGRIGEQVKAKNPDSGRVLTGVVKGPNTLEGL
mgnify:CR=1 FL=1